jgi:hypothetical protein
MASGDAGGSACAGYRQVFVLCTGRCGSLTFAEACRASIDNYSAGHESNLAITGEARLAYPHRHIEVDNRLAWFLGRLHERYGNDAFYVHLTRDPAQTARSYARRRALGFLLHAWTRGIHVGLEDAPDHLALARDMVDTVNANIRLFLADKSHRMDFALESAAEDFARFFDRIGATGDSQVGAASWQQRFNATVRPAAQPDERGDVTAADIPGSADQPLPESMATLVVFPPNAPLPNVVREQMGRLLPGPPRAADSASVTGRRATLQAQLDALGADFTGAPRLCLHVAELIVLIRRGVAMDAAAARLFSLTRHAESADFLARRLDLRWLVSVLDTWADHAAPESAATALALSVLVNTVRLAETERLVMRDPQHDPVKAQQLADAFPVGLFGGLNAFRLESGDMVRNLFARLEARTMDEPFLFAAFERLRGELRRAPSVFGRLCDYHPALF